MWLSVVLVVRARLFEVLFEELKGLKDVELSFDKLVELGLKIFTELFDREFVNKSIIIESSSKLIKSDSDRKTIKSLDLLVFECKVRVVLLRILKLSKA